MGKLTIDVLDRRNNKIIGVVVLNLLLFLKRNPSENDTQLLEDVAGVFPHREAPPELQQARLLGQDRGHRD